MFQDNLNRKYGDKGEPERGWKNIKNTYMVGWES